jgi:hypothetical protein
LRGTADVLVAVAFGYFAICFSLSQVGRYFERRTAREFSHGTQSAPAPALMVDNQLKIQAVP